MSLWLRLLGSTVSPNMWPLVSTVLEAAVAARAAVVLSGVSKSGKNKGKQWR